MYAVIQDGFGILGTGATREAAVHDASTNGGVVLNPEIVNDPAAVNYDGVHGAIYVLFCTERLGREVAANGGSTPFYVNGRDHSAIVEHNP